MGGGGCSNFRRYVDIKCLFNFFAEMNFLFFEDYDVQTAYKFQQQNPGNITYPPPSIPAPWVCIGTVGVVVPK